MQGVELTILGSESLGNCYILDSGSAILIVEAGIRTQVMKEAIGYDISRVAGCLVTHRHGDHFKYAGDYARQGIDIYSSQDVIKRLGVEHRGCVVGEHLRYTVGEFTVVPFKVHHNVPTFGYLIAHPLCGTILFATDAAYIPSSFRGINHMMIEANYSDEDMVSTRAVGSHMALDTCVEFIQRQDTTKVYSIILLHLSAMNSNAERFRSTIHNIAPKSAIHIADKGMKLQLTNNPF